MDPWFTARDDDNLMKKKQSITYAQVGDNYDTKDPIKKLAQVSARQTAQNLTAKGLKEISDSRGESAFVWSINKDTFLASVIEGLGTKNLVADAMQNITGKTYYDIIGHDTIATIINDLVTVGADPMVAHAYWGIENNDWLQDEKRMTDLISGWKSGCNIAGATWGGGETPTLKGIIHPKTVMLGGSAIGIINSKERLITDNGLKDGDRIILIKSNGINANGLSLARAIALKLKDGYATKLPSGILYGDALLTKTNIYAKLVQDLLDKEIKIHYISNITGHGHRKLMRSMKDFTYVVENILEPQELFTFIQQRAGLTDYQMYDEYNMGMDYAMFLSKDDTGRIQEVIASNGFESIDAGYIKAGERQVVIEPKNITFKGETLDLR